MIFVKVKGETDDISEKEFEETERKLSQKETPEAEKKKE